MQILEQFYTIIVLACLLLFKSFRDVLTSSFLRCLLILLLYSGTIKIIVETGNGNIAAFPLMTAYIARSLFVPAAYLYLRNHFNKTVLTRQDSIHLIPCAIFCVGCSIAYLINGNLDFLIYSSESQRIELATSGQLALLSFQFFICIMTCTYLWLIVLMLKKSYMGNEKENGYAPHVNGHSFITTTTNGTNGILNGNNGHHHEKKNGVMPPVLNEEKMSHINVVIKEFLLEKKPFLKHGYSLKQLSEEIEVPLHHLSAFINRYYRMNFNDFINEYRVNHCKVKIQNDEWKYKKLEAIADESGFSNRNTFTAAFKKVTGQNPSEYLKHIKEEIKHEKELMHTAEHMENGEVVVATTTFYTKIQA